MFTAIKRPKEYTAIKVPDDCEDVGKFVSEQFKENNIPLKVTVRYDPDAVTMIGNEQRLVHTGDVIVDDYAFDYGHDVHAISQEEFDKTFETANLTVTLDANIEPLMAKLDNIRSAVETIKIDATRDVSPTLTAYGLCDAKPIEGTSISRPKQPHVRIDIDNIHDAPHVWIDGERVDDMHGDKKPALTRVYVNWRTDNGSDMASGKHEFVIQHYENDGKNMPKEIKTGERSITDKDD